MNETDNKNRAAAELTAESNPWVEDGETGEVRRQYAADPVEVLRFAAAGHPGPAVDYEAAAERLEQAQKNFDEYDRLYTEAQLRRRWAERELNLAYDAFHRAAEAEVSES